MIVYQSAAVAVRSRVRTTGATVGLTLFNNAAAYFPRTSHRCYYPRATFAASKQGHRPSIFLWMPGLAAAALQSVGPLACRLRVLPPDCSSPCQLDRITRLPRPRHPSRSYIFVDGISRLYSGQSIVLSFWIFLQFVSPQTFYLLTLNRQSGWALAGR